MSLTVSHDGKNLSSMCYYLERESQDMLPLTGSLANVAKVVILEVGQSVGEAFVRQHLPGFLTDCLVQSDVIFLTTQLRDSVDANAKIEAANQPRAWPQLREFCSGTTAVVNDGQWNVEFNVMTARGGVEKWSVKGKLVPFSIDRLTVGIAEIDGAFDFLVRTGSQAKGKGSIRRDR